ncbi:MAG TPA: methyltransferase domain-containing protein [Pseudonocardiaceae bacterium]|jgi:SAM-dependent methyltransferase|nr:methyltransferase domain-containing protein [Pseudonocardiaceae bacterium]
MDGNGSSRTTHGVSAAADRLRIALPDSAQSYGQDSEWCVVEAGGTWQEFRFHDYGRIYEVEGLYERLFYDILQCTSPGVLRKALGEELERAEVPPGELRVLDLGAGNGIMAHELAELGVEYVVGVDLLPEAAAAAERDRPDAYRDYRVLDMSALPAGEREALRRHRPNALTCVAALGFGDIPPECFLTAFDLIEPDGWIVFTIKEDFLSEGDTSGFSRLISEAVDGGKLELAWTQRYPHRLATDGTPLRYTGVIGRKRAPLAAR